MKSSLNSGVRNGQIVFGEKPAQLASAIVFIGAQTLAIQGPFIDKVQTPVKLDASKIFNIDLTINIKAGTVVWKVDGTEIKARMKYKPASINYVGCRAWSTTTEFSELHISGK